MIKAIIFDCFGVLVGNAIQTRVEAIERTDPQAGRMLRDIMRAADRGMLSRKDYMQQLAEVMNVDPQQLYEAIIRGMVINQHLLEFIRTLRPGYKLAMLSNVRGRARLDEIFGPGQLDELFDTVVASGDVGIIKPERAIYELTLERLGVTAEDSVMIDDDPSYCEGAETVGIRAIQFNSTDQTLADLQALLDSSA